MKPNYGSALWIGAVVGPVLEQVEPLEHQSAAGVEHLQPDVAAAFGLFALGAAQAGYGPAFPALMARFPVGLDRVGEVVVVRAPGGDIEYEIDQVQHI